MNITFLGTRGYIKVRTKRHYRHTSTLISYNGKHVMIDCGIDWLGKINRIKPDAIILTHAHPDHSWGLEKGAPCPVYATKESWAVKDLAQFPIEQKIIIHDRQILKIVGITFEVFKEKHSIRCPAVGYRITAGNSTIFYSGDVVSINERHEALQDVQLYIGDGATIVRSMVRANGKQLFGHTPIRTQLGWCAKEKVPRAIFTHCGTQIVAGNPKIVQARVTQLGKERNVKATIAYDGMKVLLK